MGNRVIDLCELKKVDLVQVIREAPTLDAALEAMNGLAANGWLRLWDDAKHKDGTSYREHIGYREGRGV
jgi:hypothetical protein